MVMIMGLKLNIVVTCSKNLSWADSYSAKTGETHGHE